MIQHPPALLCASLLFSSPPLFLFSNTNPHASSGSCAPLLPNTHTISFFWGGGVAVCYIDQVIAGKKEIQVGQQMVTVRMQVEHLSFSAHADAKGERDAW